MAISRTFGKTIVIFAAGSLLGACNAAGSGRDHWDVEDPVVPSPRANSAPRESRSPVVTATPPTAPISETTPVEGSCTPASAAIERRSPPVDVIIAVDNSASMEDEARAVETSLNVNFAAILDRTGVDYRVILVSEHRERTLQDTALCIGSPLSTLTVCPSDAPGTSERFFQYSTEVGTSNSFEVLLESLTGEREDDFALAPGGWSEWLRPGARKVFIEISDDDENTDAIEFVSSLTTLAPEQFGADPSQLGFVWHSIVGVAERAIAADPYVPTDPIEDIECAGDVSNAGTTYQELSRLTGGLRFPICAFDAYDAVFERVANDLSQGATGCDFDVPAPPLGRALDLNELGLTYRPGSDGEARPFGQVRDPSDCSADAFLVDSAGIHLCPEACDALGDGAGTLEAVFACESTVLP